MSLKLIPLELPGREGSRKQKNWNPGHKIAKTNAKGKNGASPLKSLCLRLIHFVNRGSRFTYEQIDELILTLHHAILNLQKKKQEILRKRHKK